MVRFQTKFVIWVNFGGSCNGRCWNILRTFGLFYGHFIYCSDIWYLYFVAKCYIFPRLGILYQEKSGNPDLKPIYDLLALSV
jgi:hypothetical protein